METELDSGLGYCQDCACANNTSNKEASVIFKLAEAITFKMINDMYHSTHVSHLFYHLLFFVNYHVHFSFLTLREVGWVIFDEIHYMRDPGMYMYMYSGCHDIFFCPW